MLGYYVALALRGLSRNVVLTVLIVAAVGVGIGSSMATLAVYRRMAADPIPRKSTQLFALQIDNWGPSRIVAPDTSDQLQDQVSYADVKGLLKAPGPRRQAAMYQVALIVTPPNQQLHPFETTARATGADFFTMFDVPWLYGAPWTRADDEHRARVVVITREMNDQLFEGKNSVGATLKLNDLDYRVVGVLDKWQPLPRFYDLGSGTYDLPEKVFIPFTLAIALEQRPVASWSCSSRRDPGWEAFLASDCIWMQMWVELPTAADVNAYRRWLTNYALEQRRNGRFAWPARTALRDVRQWLSYHHVVSNETRILMVVSFSFLFVCLLNAMGLMLARLFWGARDIALRRALGARRRAVLVQCVVETAVVGLIGGLVGLALTALSLLCLRQLMSEEGSQLLHVDGMDVGITVLLAVVSTTLAGLYPIWRVIHLAPAPQLKTL